MKRVAARLAPELAAEVAQRRADVHYTLMGILRRASDAWERSIGVVETVREEPVMGSQGRPLKGVKRRIVTRRPDPGNPAFLTEMRGVLADLRRLWGMDSPTKVEVEDMPTPMDIAERMRAKLRGPPPAVPQHHRCWENSWASGVDRRKPRRTRTF